MLCKLVAINDLSCSMWDLPPLTLHILKKEMGNKFILGRLQGDHIAVKENHLLVVFYKSSTQYIKASFSPRECDAVVQMLRRPEFKSRWL